MVRHTDAHGIQSAGHRIRHTAPAREDQCERPRAKRRHELLRHQGHIRSDSIHHGAVCYMQDQRIVRGASLRLINGTAGPRIETVCSQPIDRFRRESNQTSTL